MSFKKCKDLILGVFMLGLSGFYLYFTQQIKTKPKLTPSYASDRIMPTILGILLAILAIILIVQGVKKLKAPDDGDGKKMDPADTMAVILTFAVIIGYVIILPMAGFCLSTIIYLFLQMIILSPPDKRNYVLFAVVAVVFTILVFIAFRIGLQQLLPRGPIEALFGF